MSKRQKVYQKCDVKNGEDRFANGTGEVSPREAESVGFELLHQHGPGLSLILSWMTGPEQRRHKEQSTGRQSQEGSQCGEPHCSDGSVSVLEEANAEGETCCFKEMTPV